MSARTPGHRWRQSSRGSRSSAGDDRPAAVSLGRIVPRPSMSVRAASGRDSWRVQPRAASAAGTPASALAARRRDAEVPRRAVGGSPRQHARRRQRRSLSGAGVAAALPPQPLASALAWLTSARDGSLALFLARLRCPAASHAARLWTPVENSLDVWWSGSAFPLYPGFSFFLLSPFGRQWGNRDHAATAARMKKLSSFAPANVRKRSEGGHDDRLLFLRTTQLTRHQFRRAGD